MPGLETTLHLDMLRKAREVGQPERDGLYGLHWGDPEVSTELAAVRDRFIAPFVGPDVVACEIGPGGGRWTRYLLGCRTVYAVDYHQELLDELAKTFAAPNIVPVLNAGSDFPGIPDGSVDFLFTFGVFVHLDRSLIAAYLLNMGRILGPAGTAVVQYSDKTKVAARRNFSFSHNNPALMRALVLDAGFEITEEDTTSLKHSSIVQFRHQRDTSS